MPQTQTYVPFIHAHHDTDAEHATPHAVGQETGADAAPGPARPDTALLAHVPRSNPEVMESIAVALLSLTVPGVCLRAGSDLTQ